jgi:hypothetical protein
MNELVNNGFSHTGKRTKLRYGYILVPSFPVLSSDLLKNVTGRFGTAAQDLLNVGHVNNSPWPFEMSSHSVATFRIIRINVW